jgi:Holliday junction resolvasome RuvABC ATP-dependent DNA helicase subunit
LVVRTPRGRIATGKSYQHLQIKPSEDTSAEVQQRLF